MKFRHFFIGLLWALCMTITIAACNGGGGGATTPITSTTTNTTVSTSTTSTAPVATAPGVPIGTAVTGTIGTAGGTLSSADSRMTISIPAGALAVDTVISIQPVTNTAHGGIGIGYSVTPDGQTFLQPVSVVLTYTDQDLEGTTPDALDMAFQRADGMWQLVDTITVDTTAKTVTASMTHFCSLSFLERFRLDPSYKTVRVNQSTVLNIEMCFEIEGPRDIKTGDRPLLGFTWQHIDPSHFYIQNWRVNGVLGGNSTYGTINNDGLYIAPATRPNPDSVMVTVLINQSWRNQARQLDSTIKIDDTPEYSGIMRFNGKMKPADNISESWTASGWLEISLERTYDSDVASHYTLTAPTKIVFDSYETVLDTTTCTMIKQLTLLETALSGETLFVQKTSQYYVFAGALYATVKMQCVDRFYTPPHVTEKTVIPGMAIMTNRSPTDIGQRPLGDGRILADSSNYTDSGPDGITTIDLTWGLTRSDL